MQAFKRLVRVSHEAQNYYADLEATNDGKHQVKLFLGDPFVGLEETGKTVMTDFLLCPLERAPLIICIGLNYKKHAMEANITIPKHPEVFYKPADALAGPSDVIYAHADTQEKLDYEGEMAFIIGKDAKNVCEEDVLDYILGYTVANDVTARNFQPMVLGGQFCYAKSFDGFAPLGHTIVPTSSVSDPISLRLTTKVNGVVKQDTNTDDMIFGVRKLVSHLSRGTTLRAGTIVLTGTPSGVGFFQGESLHDGDIVEVEMKDVGKTRNVISFNA